MESFKYRVQAFRQQDQSPIQVAFVAYSADILKWAGVPRKSDELLTGFQRFRDQKRVEGEIVPFFQDPRNCSPTAIIVGLRRESAGIGGCRLLEGVVPVGRLVETEIEIAMDVDALQGDRIFEAALGYVNDRLTAATEQGPGGGAESADSSADEEGSTLADSAAEEEKEEEEEEESAGGEEEEEEEEDEAISHLGSQTLARMKASLEDRANWANPSFREAILDYIKPAFLIDGQHRVSAAARFGQRGLPFMVCGLYGAPWEEQVFQFTVVNLRPKKIPPSLITAIAGLSLTREEQTKVEQRLDQAGVKIKDVRIMSLVAYDARSPFYGLVDMAVGRPDTADNLLGFGALKRIAKVWYRASRTSLTQIAKKLFQVKNTGLAREKWRDEEAWFSFFSAFWSAVRANYPDSLWVPGPSNRLLIGANLWALQDVLLGAADNQVASVWDRADPHTDQTTRAAVLREALLEVVQTTLNYFPAELWTTEWKRKGQDTSTGRREVAGFFQRLIDEGKKRSGVWKGWRNDKWFTTPG